MVDVNQEYDWCEFDDEDNLASYSVNQVVREALHSDLPSLSVIQEVCETVSSGRKQYPVDDICHEGCEIKVSNDVDGPAIGPEEIGIMSRWNYDLGPLICKIGKDVAEWTNDDIVGYEFEDESEAHEFYKAYSSVMGFSVRRGDRKMDKKRNVCYRRWLCSRQGYRHDQHFSREIRVREPKALTRCGCPVSFRIKRHRSTGKMVVKQFLTGHNHPCATKKEIHFLRSHRAVEEVHKERVHSLKQVGVRTSQLMDYFVGQCGGYENVGFTTKDLYNYVSSYRRKQVLDGDSESAIGYLTAKVEMDSRMYVRYTVSRDGRLGNLFWADSTSRIDYDLFGDVLVFDSTYKTNAYKMPLVIFIGANNHHSSTIFGCCLMQDETVESYDWVLTSFLHAMGGKKPISVLTDGDKAMRQAIKSVFPETRHRLCSWHLQRNCQANIKDPLFVDAFRKCMFGVRTPDEFDGTWFKAIEKSGLQGNAWVEEMYADRTRWSSAFLRETFFAGMTSTQRCEGMNSYLNRFLQSKLMLSEFVRHYDMALLRLRQNARRRDFESKHSKPVLQSHLTGIEAHAADTYTRYIFRMVRFELVQEAQYVLVNFEEDSGTRLYTIRRHGNSKSRWTVKLLLEEQKIECVCPLFASVGIPCRHAFFVMKCEDMHKIPTSLIVNRWTKAVDICDDIVNSNSQNGRDAVESARYGALQSDCMKVCHLASKSNKSYMELKAEIKRWIQIVEDGIESGKYTEDETRAEPKTPSKKCKRVKDPYVVKTKGRQPTPGKGTSRKCSKCGYRGHDKRTCIQNERTIESDCYVPTMYPNSPTNAKYSEEGDASHYNYDNFSGIEILDSDFGNVWGEGGLDC